MADQEIPFESSASRPLSEPHNSDFIRSSERLDKHVCDICGKTYKGRQGVAMHKARIHNGHKWNNTQAKKKAAKAPPQRKPDPQFSIVLREAWSDKNGRILLTDQDGNWWVARKLDV